jgi:acetoin utilization protein AcuB
MFYVYDVNGLQFSGPMEALERNKRVQASDPTGRIASENRLRQMLNEQPKDNRLAGYQQMIERENMVEPLVHIFQIMTSPAETITPVTSISDAWSRLRDKKIRQLVVTDEKMQIKGMLSDRDILHHLNTDGDEIKVEINHPVGDIINAEIITTASISDIRRVARVMAYYHLDAMPVLKETALVGIVTRGDILRGFAENPRLNLWG